MKLLLDTHLLLWAAGQPDRLSRAARRLLDNPENVELMARLETAAGLAKNLPFEVNIWKAQNNYYTMLQRLLPEFLERAALGNASAQEWVTHFLNLGSNLSVSTLRIERAQAQTAS